MHLDICRDALSEGGADRVIPVLSGSSVPDFAPEEDRWRMLVAACAGDRAILPLRLSSKRRASDTDEILYDLQKKHPEDQVFLLPPVSGTGSLCPSVQEYVSLKGLYGGIPRLDNTEPWLSRLFRTLNPHRFAHSLSVALTAVRLARRYGLNTVQSEQAGLLHDCAKCLPFPEMQKIAVKHNLTDDPDILGSPSLLHSIVGAWVARKKYGMDDPEVLEAIAYHNTGCAGMSRLAMCICLADFMEPNREPFPGLEAVRRLSDISLEKALLLSLESVAEHVCSGGKPLHPRTSGTIVWLKSLPAVQSAPDSVK